MIKATISALLSTTLLLTPVPVKADIVRATYYAGNYQGRFMSNGGRFNQHNYTAAHPSYRLNSRIKLTNVNTKRSIVVQVTDRCACSLDLSTDAYEAVGGKLRNGRVKVRITKLQ